MRARLLLGVALLSGVDAHAHVIARHSLSLRPIGTLSRHRLAARPSPCAVSSVAATLAPVIDPTPFKWPILITGGWVCLYYKYMQLGPTASFTKMSEEQQSCCNRCFLNLHEQSPPFLAAMWLHATFVQPNSAGALGAAWLVCRALYAPLRIAGGFGPGRPGLVPLSTLPSYALTLWLGISTVLSACFGMHGLRAAGLRTHLVGLFGCLAGFILHFNLLMQIQPRVLSRFFGIGED